MTDTAVTNPAPASLLEQVVVGGDLSKLSSAQRVDYYQKVCSSLGLNPLTRPFQYLSLQGRLTLYASRDATDQLRRLNRVSVTIVSRERMDDLYIVTARATLPDGRTDESIGAVAIGGLKGDALANGIMKSETKAKRRATLSVVGLGWLDETEIETIPDAHTVVEDEPKAVTPPAQPQLPPAKPTNGVHCADCDAVITARTIKGRLYTPPEIVVSTRKRFSRVLCWDCAAKATKAAHEQPEPQTNLDDTADTDAA